MQFASFQQLLQEAFGLVDIILEQTFLYFIMLLLTEFYIIEIIIYQYCGLW